MRLPLFVLLTCTFISAATAAAPPENKVIPVGTRPESVTRGFGGKLFVTVMNDAKTPGDGVVKVLEGDQARDFATGLDEPKGICFTGKLLVTTDLKRVWRIDDKGEKAILADESAFPQPVSYLNDTACEPGGKAVYVTDMGANTKMRDPQSNLWPVESPEGKALPAIGRVYRIGIDGKVTLVLDTSDDMKCPNGVSVPAKGRLLVTEFFHGNLLEARGGKVAVLATGYRGADAIEQDRRGNIYVSSWQQGKVWRFDRRGKNEQLLVEGMQSAADFYLDEKGGQLLVPDMKAGTLTFLPIR